jgi:hypothetical protein
MGINFDPSCQNLRFITLGDRKVESWTVISSSREAAIPVLTFDHETRRLDDFRMLWKA